CSASSTASQLHVKDKFFKQLAAGAIQGAVGSIIPGVVPGTNNNMNAAVADQAAAQTPAIPPVDAGLLQPGEGSAALQVGGMLPDLAAPIIFMEPPPVSHSQTLDAAEVAETTLALIGDYSSPAMKAVREYELKQLGKIAGTTLEQIRKEIRETESAIEKRKKERDELTNKLKEDGRQLAKAGNRQLELQATFTNAEKEEEDEDEIAEEMED
ncbi:uncharacterized protein LOC34624363, partial [Cyclospora cayetanensis]|uniref:Uncharacterized protein LOC34624363 n=1 Tax=Cyclospora cayetanensis TaxID=88456 RepID=A0A6P6S0P7_9EIME